MYNNCVVWHDLITKKYTHRNQFMLYMYIPQYSHQGFIRILSCGGETQWQLVCESTLMYACMCMLTRGVWGHAPPQEMLKLDPLRLLLTQSGTNFPKIILMTHTYVQ